MSIKRQLILITVTSVIVYFGLIVYSDSAKVVRSFSMFQWILIPLILSLVLIAYFIRAARWHYYLGKIGANLPREESDLVFFSGLSMVITPGKMGELIKPLLLQDIGRRVSLSRTIPVVFIERLTDLIGMTILALLGFLAFRHEIWGLLIIILLIAGVVGILQKKRLPKKMTRILGKIPKMGKYSGALEEAYRSAHFLMKPRPLGFATLLSFLTWGLEAFCLYLVFVGLGVEMGLLSAVFIFAFSSIAGVLSGLPGGIGVAEGSIVGLSMMKGVEISRATAAAILIRFCTLWFGVVVGLVSLHYLYRKSRQRRASSG